MELDYQKNKKHAVDLTMWLKDFMQLFRMNVQGNLKHVLRLSFVLHAFLLVLFIEKLSVTYNYWFHYASESGWKSELLKHTKFT